MCVGQQLTRAQEPVVFLSSLTEKYTPDVVIGKGSNSRRGTVTFPQ